MLASGLTTTARPHPSTSAPLQERRQDAGTLPCAFGPRTLCVLPCKNNPNGQRWRSAQVRYIHTLAHVKHVLKLSHGFAGTRQAQYDLDIGVPVGNATVAANGTTFRREYDPLWPAFPVCGVMHNCKASCESTVHLNVCTTVRCESECVHYHPLRV